LSWLTDKVREVVMRAYTVAIPVTSKEVEELLALAIEPDLDDDTAPVLLFLHGMGEAGSSLGELPLVCIHQTPPFQAMLGRFPGTLVLAPQAPAVPSREDWNWRHYVDALAEFLSRQYSSRRIVATGFSRGGLGVLQLVSAYPDLIQAWAAVDPQPTGNSQEIEAVLSNPALGARGWLRYGEYLHRNDSWNLFSSLLFEKLPGENTDTAELSHVQMAVQAYNGVPLAADGHKKNLYDSLGVEFVPVKTRRREASHPRDRQPDP
jgi:pimeloyl-ACP methyl ester carboxylesterase